LHEVHWIELADTEDEGVVAADDPRLVDDEDFGVLAADEQAVASSASAQNTALVLVLMIRARVAVGTLLIPCRGGRTGAR
jgi:hypothetical protein